MPQTVRSKGQKQRLDMLKAARSMLTRHGYEAFSMRSVAGEVGSKLGHLQYYFPTKFDLIEAVVRAELAKDLIELKHVIAAPSDKFEAVVRRLVQSWMSDGAQIYIIAPFLALKNPQFQKLNDEIYRTFFDFLEDVLRDIHPNDSPETRGRKVRMITAVMDGGVLLPDGGQTLEDDIVSTALLIARQSGRSGP